MTEAETVVFNSGAMSTKIPLLHLIPYPGLKALARRFERGVRIKKDRAWNALSKDQEKVLEDREFLLERLSHAIEHCYKAIGRINGSLEPLDEQDTYDGGDAGAIMFAGVLLACVNEYKSKVVNEYKSKVQTMTEHLEELNNKINDDFDKELERLDRQKKTSKNNKQKNKRNSKVGKS